MQIRLATPDDYEAVCRLIKSPEELFLVYPIGEYPLTVKQLEELAKWRIEMTVATLDDQIIGFANLYNHEPGKRAFIGNVVVERCHRGKGYGVDLIKHMIQQVSEKYDLPEIHLSVFNTNTSAMLLYAGLGFQPYALESRLDTNRQKVALVHMKKALDV